MVTNFTLILLAVSDGKMIIKAVFPSTYVIILKWNTFEKYISFKLYLVNNFTLIPLVVVTDEKLIMKVVLPSTLCYSNIDID